MIILEIQVLKIFYFVAITKHHYRCKYFVLLMSNDRINMKQKKIVVSKNFGLKMKVLMENQF